MRPLAAADGKAVVDVRMTGPRQIFTVRWVRNVLVLNFAVYAMPALLFALAPSLWLVAALFAVLAVAMWRLVASASVVMDDDGVLVVPVFRRHRLRWDRVVDVYAGSVGSAAGLTFRAPHFKMSDGSIVVATNVRSRKTPSVVDEVVTAAHSHRGRFRPPHDA